MAGIQRGLCLLVTMPLNVHSASPLKKASTVALHRFPDPTFHPHTSLPRPIILPPSANHHATMNFFYTDNSTFVGEDQTVWWSETANTEQAALPLDWTAARPIMVSVDPLRDARSYSPFESRNTPIGHLLALLTRCLTSVSGLGHSTIMRPLSIYSIMIQLNHPTSQTATRTW